MKTTNHICSPHLESLQICFTHRLKNIWDCYSIEDVLRTRTESQNF